MQFPKTPDDLNKNIPDFRLVQIWVFILLLSNFSSQVALASILHNNAAYKQVYQSDLEASSMKASR